MDFIGEAVALGIDSIIFIVCYKLYRKQCNALQFIYDVPSIEEVNEELKTVIQAAPGKKIPYVALRGTVKSMGAPLKSFNMSDVSGVIQKLTLKEHIVTRRSSGFWQESERAIQEVCNSVPFVLKTEGGEVEILDALSSDILDLETVADHFEPSTPSMLDHLWGFFTGIRQRGLETTEELLREGALITGVGELVLKQNKELAMQVPSNGAPYFLTMLPMSSLIRRLEQQKKTYRLFTLLFGAVGVVLAGWLTRKWWKIRAHKLEQEKQKRHLEETRKERRRRVRDHDLPENQLCVVCKQNPREVILLPCGHVCLCEDCSETIGTNCPVCRSQVTSQAAAYLS